MKTKQIIIISILISFFSCDKKAKSDKQLTTNSGIHNKDSIVNYFNEIYKQEKLIKAKDNQMLSITDSLFSKDINKGLFYFIVFTKSLNGADGFYSEGAGLAAFNYISNNPKQFAQYFETSEKLNPKDLDNWANSVLGEIMISRENDESKAIDEFEVTLTTKMKEDHTKHQEIISDLMKRIKNTAHDKLNLK